MDIPRTGRGGAAAAAWIVRGDEERRGLGRTKETGARLRYQEGPFDVRFRSIEAVFEVESTLADPPPPTATSPGAVYRTVAGGVRLISTRGDAAAGIVRWSLGAGPRRRG